MNLIYSNITDQLYADRIRRYESILRFNDPNLSNLDEITLVLSKLKKHRLIWSNIKYLGQNLCIFFQKNFILPMKAPKIFATTGITPEFSNALNKSKS
jgi:hypothetical protein